jgi:hypothetical protein
MAIHEQFQFGLVMPMQAGSTGPSGHGFNIETLQGSPVVSFLYPSKDEAKKGRAAIKQALAKAIAVTTPGPVSSV